MILSQTIGCVSQFGDLKGIELIAEAGFDAIDYNLGNIVNNPLLKSEESVRKYVGELQSAAKNNGVYFNQGHAVSYVPHEDHETCYNLLVEKNIESIKVSSLLGIKTLVVHPVDAGDYIGREEIVFEKNIRYFRTLLPYAEKYGVKIACENMWCGDKKRGVRIGSVCSNPYEHARYVDEINNEMFVACLDVGHSSIAGRQAEDCIRVLGNRLEALHIHDNDYLDDMHTLPGLSEMNWDEITKALADMDYKGDFTFETDHFFDSLNTVEESRCGLKLAELIGRKLIKKIEAYK